MSGEGGAAAQPRGVGRSNVLVVTNRIRSGGSIYEHMVYEQVRPRRCAHLFEFDPESPRLLRWKKLRYWHQLRQLDTEEYDVVITNVTGAFAGLLGRSGPREVLIVHHLHSGLSRHAALEHYLERVVVGRLDRVQAVVTVSDYWRRAVAEYMSEERVFVIKNAFDIEMIDRVITDCDLGEFRRRHNIPLDKKIVYGGNSMKAKGIERTANYVRQFDDLHLVTSGRQDVDCGSQHLMLRYPDYLCLLRASDVSVILSRMPEGWNRCAHESLLCGTPVVGRKVAGLGELIEESGQYFLRDGAGPTSFREVVDRAIRDERRTVASAAILRTFGLEYFRNRWMTVIEKMAD